MKYLGLDLGTKTLGVAISDLTKTIASPYTTIHFEDSNYDDAITSLKDILDQERIEKIILGFPKNMNNSIGERAKITMAFKKKLEKELDIPIEFQDERLTSKQAENYMLEADMSRKKRKQRVDYLAANIILQSYLDKRKD